MTEHPPPLPDEDEAESPSEALKLKIAKWRERIGRFRRTRAAILGGEPLFDLTRDDLRTRGYLNAWQFNVIESTLVSAPFAAITGVATALAPDTIGLTPAGEIVDAFHSALTPLILPFLLFLLAGLVARASFRRGEATPAGIARAKRAYLYYEGAHGFYPELIQAGAITFIVIVASLTNPETKIGDFLWSIGGLFLLAYFAAVLWLGYIVRATIPSRLFVINGYSGRRMAWWKLWTRDWTIGPWNRYVTMVGCGGGCALIFVNLSVLMLAIGVGALLRLFG